MREASLPLRHLRRPSIFVAVLALISAIAGCGGSPHDSPSVSSTIVAASGRVNAAVGLVGDRVYVVGGYHDTDPVARRDAVAFELPSGVWRSVPPIPVGRALHYPAGVAVGAHLVVLGTQCSARVRLDEDDRVCSGSTKLAAVSFDRTRGRWRELELPGGLPRERLLEEIALGATAGDAWFRVRWPSKDHDDLLLRINPVTGATSTASLPPDGASAICANEMGVTAVHYLDQATAIEAPDGGPQDVPVTLSATRLAGKAWSEPIRFRSQNQAPVAFSSACAGRSIVVLSSGGVVKGAAAFVFDGAAWRVIGAPPVDVGYRPQYVWTGAEVVLWGTNALLGLNPQTDEWRRIVTLTRQPSRVFWNGHRLVLYDEAAGSAPTVDTLDISR